jgi:hypothetical protein
LVVVLFQRNVIFHIVFQCTFSGHKSRIKICPYKTLFKSNIFMGET